MLSLALAKDPRLVRKIYLLEDCSSPVVVPGVIDYSDAAAAAYRRFAETGMHVVRSTESIADWMDMMERPIANPMTPGNN